MGRRDAESHSAVAPESATRSAHFGSSAAMNAAKSAGEPGFTIALKRARFSTRGQAGPSRRTENLRGKRLPVRVGGSFSAASEM